MAQQSNKVTGPRCFSCASSALKSQWQVTGFPRIPNVTAVGEKAFLFQDANCGDKPEYKDDIFVTPVSSCPGGICIEMLLVADGIYSVLRGCVSDFFDYPPSSGEEGCTMGLSTESALITTSMKGEQVQNVRVGVNLCSAKEGSQCNSVLSPSIEYAQGKQHMDASASTGDAWPYSCRKSTSMVECVQCSRYDWDGDCHWNIREYCIGAWCTKTIGYVNGRWLEQRGCAPINPLNSQVCTKIETESALTELSGQDVKIRMNTEQCFCRQNRCNSAFTLQMVPVAQLLLLIVALCKISLMILIPHFGFGLSLAELLAQDGHQVHILAPIRDENDKLSDEIKKEGLTIQYFKKTTDTMELEIIGDMELMNKLKAEKFDVGIVEAFMSIEYTLAILHFLEIPETIATHSQPMSNVQLYLLGVMSKMKSGNFLASVGQPTLRIKNDEERRKAIGTRIGDHRANQLEKRGPEIWEHCVNQTLKIIRQYITQDTLYQKLADEKFGGKIFPGWAELFKRTRFFLVNSQPEVDFGKFENVKGIEKVKFIGGFDLKKVPSPKLNLPVGLEAMSKKGVVLISLGTNVNTTKPEFSYIIEAIKGAVQKFPNFFFIWKVTDGHPMDTLVNLGNVMPTFWVKQKEILAHPKTMAFLSHCGMNSVLESTYYGVPMVCVPFFGDQYYNSESLARQNIGLVVDREQKDTVEQELTVALAKALGQKEMLETVQNFDSEDQIDLGKVKAGQNADPRKWRLVLENGRVGEQSRTADVW
uniref:glucuronosyltransferase n=1 Tax=Globodera rostochiensis TaxID=31243 RepID=A0A914ICP5_GLORO